MALLLADRTRLSVPLEIFLLAPGSQSLLWKVISDASPWRLAAGLYDYRTGCLLCWTTLLLPYSSSNAHRYQTQWEYLGHLLSLLLILAHSARSPSVVGTTSSYQWMNNNTGAISWVNTHKCRSLAGLVACMAVSQINLLADVWAADAIHIPGSTMGEIDAMSRLEVQSDPETAFPTLNPDTYLSLHSPAVISLFERCDPALTAGAPGRSSKLLSTMVDPDTVFVMLSGGFGHASTPMQWDVVGGAILTRVTAGCPIDDVAQAPPPCDVGPLECPVDMYVDDSFGAGRADHVQTARDRLVLVCNFQG